MSDGVQLQRKITRNKRQPWGWLLAFSWEQTHADSAQLHSAVRPMQTSGSPRIKWGSNFKKRRCMQHIVDGEGAVVLGEKYFDTEKSFMFIFLNKYAFFWNNQVSNLLQRSEVYRYFGWFPGILNQCFVCSPLPPPSKKNKNKSLASFLKWNIWIVVHPYYF